MLFFRKPETVIRKNIVAGNKNALNLAFLRCIPYFTNVKGGRDKMPMFVFHHTEDVLSTEDDGSQNVCIKKYGILDVNDTNVTVCVDTRCISTYPSGGNFVLLNSYRKTFTTPTKEFAKEM